MEALRTRHSTPWHFWVLGAFLFLWQSFAAFDYFATLFRYEPYLSNLPQDVLEHYFASPGWMYITWAVASVGGFIAAVLFLARNKLAVPAYGAAWIGGLVANLYGWFNPPPGMEDARIFSVIIVALTAVLFFYVYSMKKRGVLR